LREYIYIEDLLDAVIMISERTRGIYNIGTGQTKSNVEVVKEIIQYFNVTPIDQYYPYTCPIKQQSLDSTKIKEEFNWKPRYTFQEGIRKTIEWWKSWYPRRLHTA